MLDDEGEVVARAPSFEEELLVVDLDPAAASGGGCATCAAARWRANARRAHAPAEVELRASAQHADGSGAPCPAEPLDDLEQMRLALELGLRDYVRKNGFGDVVIGLSGGIDSALTAALAVGALGADRVHGVSMPSRFSSEGTRRRRAAARRVARDRLPRDPDRADRRGVRRRRSRRRSRGASPT